MLKRVCRVVSSEDEGENVNTPKEKHKKRLQELANKVNQVPRNYSLVFSALRRGWFSNLNSEGYNTL